MDATARYFVNLHTDCLLLGVRSSLNVCSLQPSSAAYPSSLVATVLTYLERMEAYCAAGRGGWFEACRGGPSGHTACLNVGESRMMLSLFLAIWRGAAALAQGFRESRTYLRFGTNRSMLTFQKGGAGP